MFLSFCSVFIIIVSLPRHEQAPFVYIMVCLHVYVYSHNQNQVPVHDMINLLYCQGYIMELL